MTDPDRRQPFPWMANDLLRWFTILGAAAAGLVVAWWGASGTTRTSVLVMWINVGAGALIVAGLANMRWLLQGRRAVALRRRSVLPLVTALTSGTVVAAGDDVRVAVTGTSRHHRPDCAAVAGKTVDEGTVAEHERAGRQPCGLCER